MRRPLLTALALAALPFAWLVARFSFVCDDAYIAFRYSRNFARGLGLRYNLGVEPPVEGYTQLGWIVWIGLFQRLGLDPTFWARATTIACGAALLAWVAALACRRFGFGVLATSAAALFFATQPTVAVWSTGGLETMAFALFLFGAYERLLGDDARPRGLQTGALAVLAALTRADGVYWLGITLGFALASSVARKRPDLRRAALTAGALVAVALAAQAAWRWSYYEDWVPNTVRAKVGLSALSLGRGLRYLLVYLLTVPAVAAIAVWGGLAAAGRRHAALSCSALLVLATFLYAVLVGGDFMAWGRFLVPAMPHLALLLGFLVQGLVERGRAFAAGALTGACLLLSILPAYDVHVVPESLRARLHFRWNVDDYVSETEQWRRMNERVAGWTETGRALKLFAKPGDSLVVGGIGAVGYYSDVFVYDRFALVDREAARVPPAPGRRSPGHDRMVPTRWFARFEPTYSAANVRPRRAGDPPPDSPGGPTERGTIVYPLRPEDGFERGRVLELTPFPLRGDG